MDSRKTIPEILEENDLDPEFVAFHHIMRLLLILFFVPIILRLIRKKGSANT